MSIISVTESNRGLVTGMYEAAQRGDFEAFFSVLDPDVVINEPQYLPYGGTYRGVAELQGLLQRIAGILDVTGMQVDQIIADEERVIGLLRVPLVGTEKQVYVAEMSICRDGRVTEIWLFFHDTGDLLER